MNQTLPSNSTTQFWNSILPYLVLSFFLLLAIYWQTLSSMLSTWWNIGTYTHGFVIFPISLWVIWTLKDSVTILTPKPTVYAVITVLVVSLIWLVANQGGLIGIQQFALIGLIQVLTWAMLGKAVYKKLLFPLLFLFLAVPFGDFLIKPMMEFTADCTVMLLRLSGIPVYRNGLYLMLPTGHWSVVAACSGVRYLIASITVGILFAYFCYFGWRKRLIFTAASIITPIIANSLRAYIIVLIGHFSNMKFATGVDHFVYGWVFFGIVIAIMMWVGSLFQDHPQDDIEHVSKQSQFDHPVNQSGTSTQTEQFSINTITRKTKLIASLALLASTIGPLSAYVLKQQPQHQVDLDSITLPESSTSWRLINDIDEWQPGYTGQTLTLSSMYQSQLGRVQLTMIFYPNETQGHELINGQNSLVPEDNPDWRLVLESMRSVDLPPTINLRESLISTYQHRLIWQFNWINGQFETNDTKAKLMAVKNRLLGNNNHSIAVIISTQTGEDTVEARQRLNNFLQAMSPTILEVIKQFNTIVTIP